jgi:hypothetical protein
MTIHDTCVFLKSGSPYDPIKYLFPQGLPMRDPFPMLKGKSPDGSLIVLWVVDSLRLNYDQFNALAHLIASHCNASIADVLDETTKNGGFAINEEWVEHTEVGAEGYARTMELKAFLESKPQDAQALKEFNAAQIERWVDGDTEPPPLPTSIEEIDPNLRTPELARAIEQNRINQLLASKNYSVFDVLTGEATVDILNELDPEHNYALFKEEDENDGNY